MQQQVTLRVELTSFHQHVITKETEFVITNLLRKNKSRISGLIIPLVKLELDLLRFDAFSMSRSIRYFQPFYINCTLSCNKTQNFIYLTAEMI